MPKMIVKLDPGGDDFGALPIGTLFVRLRYTNDTPVYMVVEDPTYGAGVRGIVELRTGKLVLNPSWHYAYPLVGSVELSNI